MIGAGPGAHQVQRLPPGGAVVAAPQGLAVDGNHLTGGDRGEVADPADKRGFEGGGVEGGEDPTERVVGGDAVGQGEEGAQPGFLAASKLGNVDPGVGPAHHGAQRDGHDVQQLMAFAAVDAGVGQVSKVLMKGAAGQRVHGGGSSPDRDGSPSHYRRHRVPTQPRS